MPPKFRRTLRPLAPEIERAGRCFVTQAGLHPGLPATLIRYVASRFERCDEVEAGMLLNVGSVPGTDAVVELIEEMAG